MTDAIVERWLAELLSAVGERRDEEWRKVMTAGFARLKSDAVAAGIVAASEDAETEARWRALTPEPFDAKAHALGLAKIACERDGAPHVARGILRNDVFRHAGEHVADFAKALRAGRGDPAKCPGVAGFTDEDWRRLDGISPPPAAAPR